MKLFRRILTKYMMPILSGVAIFAMVSVSYARADSFLLIERPKLGLGASYEFEEEKRTIPGIETKTTSHDMLEKVAIETKGWVYHPNLMEYHISFEPEWHQETFRRSQSTVDLTQTNRRDTSVLAYDGETTLFKQKPFSLDIFGNRNTRQIDLSYTQDTDIEGETWGTRLNFTNPLLPASIGFINRQSVQTGFYRSEEDRNDLQVKIRHNVKRSVTELNILRDDTERITRTTSEFTGITSNTTNAELTNTYFITSDERVKLDSLFYLTQAEYDEIDIETWLVSEYFFWTPRKNLLTQSTFNFNRREANGSEIEEKALNTHLIHRLGDMLTTNLGAGVAFNDFAGGSEDRYRSDLGFIYRRPIPWGSIKLGVAYDYGMTDRNGTGNIILTQEHHVLTTSEETFLKEENVTVESILVTDVTGTIVYAENIDYRIITVGSDARVIRNLMGAIADGQQVLVRYSYRVDAGYDDARFGQDYQLDLELGSFIYMSYSHRRLDQTILSEVHPADRADDTFNSARLRIDTGWSETRFEFEKQDRRSGNSSVTKSVSELINFRPFKSLSFNFSGHYGKREYTDTNKKETFYTLGADIGWTPKWWCTFSLICQKNKISGDQLDMLYTGISPTVKLTYGVWTGTLSYRLRDQEDEQNGDSLWRQEVFFTINRRLW